jgi:DNA-binding NtrC family response regulator
MEKAFKKVIASFEKDLKTAINKAWPMLVAAELLKLQNEPKSAAVEQLQAQPEPPQPSKFRVPDLSNVSDSVILAAYGEHGSKSGAARALHMPESTFRERLKKAQAVKAA